MREIKVNIGVSNRHVHLTEDVFKKLFGENAVLEKQKDLTQPGQFAATAKVTIKTDKSTLENVRVLGPFRNYNQVEISKTDAFKLGVNPPVRDSGDLDGSASVTLIGPAGEVTLSEGCIIATRHIHLTPDDVVKYGLEGKTSVNVRVDGDKGGIFYNVSLKVSPDYLFEMHIDTDDANGHLISQGNVGTIIIDD